MSVCRLCRVSTPAHQATRSFAAAALAHKPAAHPPPSTADLLQDTRDLVQRYPLLQHTSWATRLDGALADLKHERRARVAGASRWGRRRERAGR